MFWVWVRSLASVAVVSLLSLVGIFTFMLRRELSKRSLLYLVSFSVGGLLGGAFIHLIPEAFEANGVNPSVSIYILTGILSSYVIEMFLRWRHCHIPTSDEHPHSFAYMNLIGDGIHNMVDGMLIGGSYLVSAHLGLVTTLAICLHELPQEIGDFGVLLYAGFERRRALLYNFLTALTAFIGVFIAITLNHYVANLTEFLIPFAAGNFIYIAGSDLVPELQDQKEFGQSLIQLVAMILGILLLLSIKLLTGGEG